MTWFRIGFDDAIAHAVHESLREQLVDDGSPRHPSRIAYETPIVPWRKS